jgi:hypothetical protein
MTPKKLSPQETSILFRLQNGERLSQPSIIGEGCWRLASRVSAIRKHGWNVQTFVLPGGFKEYFIDPKCPHIVEEDEQQIRLPLGEMP